MTTINKTIAYIDVVHFDNQNRVLEGYKTEYDITDMSIDGFVEKLEIIARLAGYEVPEGSITFNPEKNASSVIKNQKPSDPTGVVVNLFEKND